MESPYQCAPFTIALHFSCTSRLFSRQCWLLKLHQKHRVAFVPITSCCVLMWVNWNLQKVTIIPANIRPVIIELIIQLSGHGLPQRKMLRYKIISKVTICKILRRRVLKTSRIAQQPHGNQLMMTTPREDRALSPHHRPTGHRVSVQSFQRRLVAGGYRPRNPVRCPRLTPNHCRRRMWTSRQQNWNHQHRSYAIFADISLYNSDDHDRDHEFAGVLMKG